MAKKAKVNLSVNTVENGVLEFVKGKVYLDSDVTSEVDASNFEDVSEEAVVSDENMAFDEAGSSLDDGTDEKKTKKSSKKVPGEELE